MNLLSKRTTKRTGELALELPTASEDAVENNEQQNGQKSSAGEAVSSIAVPVSVVPVRAKVRTMEAIRVPERAEDKPEDQRDCDEDEDGWDNDKGEHCAFSIQTAVRETGSPKMMSPASREKSARVGFAVFARLHGFHVGHEVVKVHA